MRPEIFARMTFRQQAFYIASEQVNTKTPVSHVSLIIRKIDGLTKLIAKIGKALTRKTKV